MLQFLPGYAWFAIAGTAAAAGPLVIHLLNRRRFRVVHWAAMDFLREAVRRNRRILELRDIILLILRTLAVLLFGLALARPFVPVDSTVAWRVALPAAAGGLACTLAGFALWRRAGVRNALIALSVALFATAVFFGGRQYWQGAGVATDTKVDASQPLHAVLLIDNSLSMSYTLERSLLDEAKERADRFIEQLPEGSHIAVLPLCGPDNQFNRDPFPDKQDARSALGRITVVDRRATAADAIAMALDACGRAPEFPQAAKRVVLFGDQQQTNWPADAGASLAAQIARLPELQVVDVSATDPTNSFVASVVVEDGLADVETPAKIIARIRHEGREPRDNVQATLWVDGLEAASQTIDRLEPGGEREVVFHHQFHYALSPGETRHVPVKVTLPPDRLTMDDERYIAVPIVAALPVVFVDQLGADGEKPAQRRFGETLRLRQLLAPNVLGEERGKQLVHIRHVTIEQLDRKLLADARLVVIAGVPQPTPAAAMVLREYVVQGGQLIVAAGGGFESLGWTERAWQNGAGVLPVPLDGVVGQSLDEDPAKLDPFFIAYDSTAGREEFHIAGESPESHAAFYRDPLFFKAVRANVSTEFTERFIAAESRRIADERQAIAEADERLSVWQRREAEGTLTASDRAARDQELSRRAEIRPTWLAWRRDGRSTAESADVERAARDTAPRVLARFTNQLPFLVERRIGRGDVLFVASGVYSSWNTWPTSYTMFLADRLMRRRIERTLPMRTVDTARDVAVPIDANDAQASFTVTRPDGATTARDAEALDADSYGVTIDTITARGIYQLALRSDKDVPTLAIPTSDNERQPAEAALDAAAARWKTPLVIAANGPEEESELASVGGQRLRDQLAAAQSFRWVAPGEPISVEGAAIEGQNLWWWLTVTVLSCLALEMTTIAVPSLLKH